MPSQSEEWKRTHQDVSLEKHLWRKLKMLQADVESRNISKVIEFLLIKYEESKINRKEVNNSQ
jgi:hypothetical protein